MKKLIAIVAFVAAMFVAGNAQAQLSVRFGYAPETPSSKYTILSPSGKYDGFFVGIHNNFNLKSGLQFSLGVQGRYNMNNSEISNALGSEKTKDSQLVLDVPITLNYSIAFGQNVKITPFVGPMIDFALNGQTKVITRENVLGTTNEHTTNWYNNNSNLSRLNLSVIGGVNVKYVRLNLFCGYQMGLLDLNKSDNVTLKTNGFFVGLGYDL